MGRRFEEGSVVLYKQLSDENGSALERGCRAQSHSTRLLGTCGGHRRMFRERGRMEETALGQPRRGNDFSSRGKAC